MLATVLSQTKAYVIPDRLQAEITEDERVAFKQVFDQFDVNKDGHITSSEVKTVLNRLGQNPSDEEIQQFIQVCDTDKNNTIEFGEFCRYLVDIRREVRKLIITYFRVLRPP